MPLLDPRPIRESIPGRLVEVVRHRANVSTHAKAQFPRDALRSMPEKFAALAVQGFGRFGPFGPAHSDSTRRFDLSQDWGAIPWLPLVMCGLLVVPLVPGTPNSDPPSLAWTIPHAYLITILTVGLFLPLAWDRYFLPIQSGSCLLGASGRFSWAGTGSVRGEPRHEILSRAARRLHHPDCKL